MKERIVACLADGMTPAEVQAYIDGKYGPFSPIAKEVSQILKEIEREKKPQ